MNTTANRSSSSGCYSLVNPEALKVGATVAYSLILVVSLVGNSLIVLIVYKTPTLRKPINMLIANMAMSDLLYPIFLFPVRLAEMHVGWWLIGGNLGQALCKIHTFLADISSLVSIQNLVLITVDRFGAVVVPVRSPLISRKSCPFFIVTTWIIAMAFHSPYFFAFRLVEYPGGMLCKGLWQEAFGGTTYAKYHLTGAIVFFYIPSVLLVIIYSIILLKLKKQGHPGEQSSSNEEQRARRNKNVLKMAIAIVLVFVISWVPYHTSSLLLNYVPEISFFSSCSFFIIRCITYYLAIANCAINPYICVILSSNYRQGLKKLLT